MNQHNENKPDKKDTYLPSLQANLWTRISEVVKVGGPWKIVGSECFGEMEHIKKIA